MGDKLKLVDYDSDSKSLIWQKNRKLPTRYWDHNTSKRKLKDWISSLSPITKVHDSEGKLNIGATLGTAGLTGLTTAGGAALGQMIGNQLGDSSPLGAIVGGGAGYLVSTPLKYLTKRGVRSHEQSTDLKNPETVKRLKEAHKGGKKYLYGTKYYKSPIGHVDAYDIEDYQESNPKFLHENKLKLHKLSELKSSPQKLDPKISNKKLTKLTEDRFERDKRSPYPEGDTYLLDDDVKKLPDGRIKFRFANDKDYDGSEVIYREPRPSDELVKAHYIPRGEYDWRKFPVKDFAIYKDPKKKKYYLSTLNPAGDLIQQEGGKSYTI